VSILNENTASERPSHVRHVCARSLGPVLLIPGMFLAFFALAVGIHHDGFHSRMMYDSVGFIAENAPTFARHDIRGVMGIVPARPLFMVTLYLNYLWAGMDPYWFRVVNALILAAAGLVLTALSVLIFEMPSLRIPGTYREKRAVAFVLGLWFVVHPLQSLVVLYIWQREAILACFFLLSATTVYIAGRSGRLVPSSLGPVITSMLFLAGILCKENMIVLPAILLLAEWTLFQQDFKPLLVRAGIIALISVPPLVGSVWLIHSLHGPDATHMQGIWNRLEQYYHTAGLTLTEVILTECRVLFSYLFTIGVPFRSGVQLVAAETISRSLLNPPQTLAAVVGAAAFVTAGLALIRRMPVAAFGMLFFVVALLPESLLIPLYLFCGYRAVLPMAGILLVVGQFMLNAVAIPGRTGMKSAIAIMLLTTLVLSTWTTIKQARSWSPLQVWEQAYRNLPPFSENVEVTPYLDILGSYGMELSHAGRYDAAIHVLGQAASIESEPNAFKKTLALVNMGLVYQKKGDMASAIDRFAQAARCDPADPWPHFQLGAALVEAGRTEEGLASLRKAVELNPRDAAARLSLGNVLMARGRVGEAIDQYQEAARLDPGSAAICTMLAKALEQSGNLPLAAANYRKAAELNPGAAEFHFNLAKSLAQQGNVQQAIEGYQRAVELNPTLGPAYANLGSLLLQSGRMPEASASLRRAQDLVSPNAELTYQYGVALHALGKDAEAAEQFRKALTIKPDHAAAHHALKEVQ
jgi:protein O-mannosyl-transferase